MPLRYEHLEKVEKHAGLLGLLIAIMVSLGGLAEITPLFLRAQRVEPAPGVKPYDALRLAGKDIYVREACYQCHKAAGKPYQRPMVPTITPQTIINYDPKADWPQ